MPTSSSAQTGPTLPSSELVFLGSTIVVNILFFLFFTIMLFVCAILTSVLATDLGNSTKGELITPRRWVIGVTVTLWILWSISLIFLIVGYFILPFLFAIPYVAGAIFIIIAGLFVLLAGVLIYVAISIYGSIDYKNNVPKVKRGYSLAIGSAVFVFIVSGLLTLYAVIYMVHFHHIGGIRKAVEVGYEGFNQVQQFEEMAGKSSGSASNMNLSDLIGGGGGGKKPPGGKVSPAAPKPMPKGILRRVGGWGEKVGEEVAAHPNLVRFGEEAGEAI
jgi:hypothetical protein